MKRICKEMSNNPGLQSSTHMIIYQFRIQISETKTKDYRKIYRDRSRGKKECIACKGCYERTGSGRIWPTTKDKDVTSATQTCSWQYSSKGNILSFFLRSLVTHWVTAYCTIFGILSYSVDVHNGITIWKITQTIQVLRYMYSPTVQYGHRGHY